MTADDGAPLLPADPDEKWRRIFVLAITNWPAANVDYLELDGWAVRAQARHGLRNAVEVAHEEWTCGKQ